MILFLRLFFLFAAIISLVGVVRTVLQSNWENVVLFVSTTFLFGSLAYKTELLSDSASIPDTHVVKVIYQLSLAMLVLVLIFSLF